MNVSIYYEEVYDSAVGHENESSWFVEGSGNDLDMQYDESQANFTMER